MKNRFLPMIWVVSGILWGCAASAAADTGAAITVSGRGAVTAPADLAIIEVSVETTDAKAAAAASANAKRTRQVLRALSQFENNRTRIETRGYRLSAVYRSNDRRRPSGFQARNTIAVHIPVTSDIGQVVDTAIQAGANRILGIRFDLSQRPALRQKALALAVADATVSAKTMATAAGARLGPLINLRTAPARGRGMDVRAMEMNSATTPIRASQLTVEATVELVMGLEIP